MPGNNRFNKFLLNKLMKGKEKPWKFKNRLMMGRISEVLGSNSIKNIQTIKKSIVDDQKINKK